MDLGLYARVIWRFRFVVALGLVAAIALSVLSYARVSFQGGRPHLTPRQPETFGSSETLLITQGGFPWGRTSLPFTLGPDGVPQSSYGDPSRFAGLAGLYSQFANSDDVQAIAQRLAGGAPGGFAASPVRVDSSSTQTLPAVTITSVGPTPSAAIRQAQAAGEAFTRFLASNQDAANIPKSQRVMVQVLNRARAAAVVSPRKKTLPVVVFLALMAATIGLAFVLENLRPHVREVIGTERAANVEQARDAVA